jgi:DNA-binding NtrC family response regulator
MAKRKKKTTDLDYWLGSTVAPVFVLDTERRIRAFNAGCQALTGWTPGDVVGETCHYGSVSEIAGSAALAASLCPPPEVFAGEQASAPAFVNHREGHALPRMLHFFPLRDDKARLSGVLGVVSPMPSADRGDEVSSSRQLHVELAAVRMTLRARFGSNLLVARSLPMRRVLAQVEIARNSPHTPVLLSGAPGTGREHLARVIHFSGAGKGSSFVPLDCRRLAPEELERVWNRLFESVRPPAGAETAAGPKPGTVFLADVEYLPRDLQQRLAAVFSEGPGNPPPLRLLAATSKPATDLVAAHHMRPDFYAIASPLTIEIPALAERRDDLPLLAQHFLEEFNRQQSKQVGGFDEQIWPLLIRYDWPGNLDELAAVVGDAHAHATETFIHPRDLPYRFRTALASQEQPAPREPPPMLLDPLLTKVETRLITLALERTRNNKSKAAELLGINRARLLRRIEQLQIGQPTSDLADTADADRVEEDSTGPPPPDQAEQAQE